MLSKRGQAWQEFSAMVLDHIENYTVPQYLDEGEDAMDSYTPLYCLQCIGKYINRFGRSARGETEQARDFAKLAHYAQIAWTNWRREQ